MGTRAEPRIDLAGKALPKPLFKALEHIFAQKIQGCVLAGGTALSGFYAGHRRSDDLDLFTDESQHQQTALLAIRSLAEIGATLEEDLITAQYAKITIEVEKHLFTVTAVQDRNLFRVGKSITLENGVAVVDLLTLFKMKAATLVSRCSEKDLYDLIWLFGYFKQYTLQDLISLGQDIDAGLNGEAILLSLSGTSLREEACNFLLTRSTSIHHVYAEIKAFQKKLLRELSLYLHRQRSPSLLAEIVKDLRKLQKAEKG